MTLNRIFNHLTGLLIAYKDSYSTPGVVLLRVGLFVMLQNLTPREVWCGGGVDAAKCIEVIVVIWR